MKENEIEVWGTTEAQDVSSNAVNSRGEKCRIVRTYDYYPDAQEIHEHVSIQNAVSIKLVEFNAYKVRDLHPEGIKGAVDVHSPDFYEGAGLYAYIEGDNDGGRVSAVWAILPTGEIATLVKNRVR